MKIVTSADFEKEVLKSDKPVLVDFFATWCGPCKMLAPTLDKVAAATADTVKIVKVDIDASPELAKQYLVTSYPTLFIIRDGKAIAKKIGGTTQASLLKWIGDSLALPAGTALDLTAKILSETDKRRLRDAFNIAMNNSPEADITVPALDGSQTTIRKAVKENLDSGVFFRQVEEILNRGTKTLDQFIEDTKKSTFTIPKKGPNP
jgi:thioredoxin 1